jgi:poly(A) polymerase
MQKLFLAGHALSGFREMERYGLFAVLFPESAQAIRKDPRGRALIEAALASTDGRIALGRPVTPAFLFAALLWPAVEHRAALIAERGHGDPEGEASAQIVAEQAQRIALPKRFSLPMQEIWDLQPRFATNHRKRVQRLLAHPRFRAAYDFLLLRSSAHLELVELAQRWDRAQHEGPDAVLAGQPMPDRAAPIDAPAKKKRRRRRRKPGEAVESVASE